MDLTQEHLLGSFPNQFGDPCQKETVAAIGYRGKAHLKGVGAIAIPSRSVDGTFWMLAIRSKSTIWRWWLPQAFAINRAIGGWHLSDAILSASNPKQIHHLAMVATASVRYQSRNRWMAPFGC
jgi:hypothetical protein